ncbi:MAG: DNA topoisomerase III [Ruminococcus albus]|nr:DNA topoisomerase III [Ruminococcus albus]
MKLVIAEKPSVAKAIAPVLGAETKKNGYTEGNGFIVSWCFGHLVGLKFPNDYGEKWAGKWSFAQLPMIPDEWLFKINKDCDEQFGILKKLMNDKNVDEVICATDADREGECIFRYVYQMARCRKPVKRLWVSSLEESAIRQALSNMKPMSDYDNLFYAGFSRAKADWLVGMNGSRLFSVRYAAQLNTGRVQTPTLAMIVKRDHDVKNFVKQKYYTVVIDCDSFSAETERIDDESAAEKILEKVKGKPARITDVIKETKTVNPPKLYDLTTLQRDANKQFGYTAKQTLDYLQALYEAKLSTYPRTDSQYLSDDMQQTAADMVKTVYSVFPDFGTVPDSVDVKRCINNKKVTGHHAIIPTSNIAGAELSSLPDGQRNILMLISARLILATADPHKYESVKVNLDCGGVEFTASGKTIMQNGWKAIEEKVKAKLKNKNTDADENDESVENNLSDCVNGKEYAVKAAEKSEHWTSPPKPYTEDTLLSAMEHAGMENYDDDTEKKGLGTPATRAATIEGLVLHGYAERKGKQITATEKGVSLIEVVPNEVKSPKLTADWEMQLQQIERGEFSGDVFMQGITDFVRQLVSTYSERAENAALARRFPVVGVCPKCGGNVYSAPKAYFCEKGKEACGFGLAKTIMDKNISEAQFKKMLEKGSTDEIEGFVSKKTGNKFSAFLVMKEDKSIGIKLPEKVDNPPIGKCPKCGNDITLGKFGFYCKGKCGFFPGKVFGKALTEDQLKTLLSGKQISFASKGKRTVVLPQIEQHEYEGKVSYQWKTAKG